MGQNVFAMEGVINLDKPPGMSSARAVDQVKRLLPFRTKIGHAGTLDPFATGVLVLLIGKATKRCEELMDQPKQYDMTMKLGATTTTDDPESPEVTTPGFVAESITLAHIRELLPRFIGPIQQRPPAFSALKIRGKRAYDLARRGEHVELEARTVHVYGIELLDYTPPLLRLRIDCGRGTYIRSIARDLGAALGAGGYLTQLRRTRVGDFAIEQAVSLPNLQQNGVPPYLTRAST
jgi:tRNA pseudouridine55 synthase